MKVLRMLLFLCVWFLLQGCITFKPNTDTGQQDLYSNGLSPNYNQQEYSKYLLKIQLPQLLKDTVFRHVSSRAFIRSTHKVSIERPNYYPRDNWDATVNDKGFVIIQSFLGDSGAVWTTDSFAYSFKRNRLVKMCKYNSRWKVANIKYGLDYNDKGYIKRIAILTHDDSLIVQRTYQYHGKKLQTSTINGKKNTVEQKEIVFNSLGKVIEETDNFILKGTFKRSKMRHLTDSTFIKNWDEYDSDLQIIATGHERYRNGLLIESDANHTGSWKHRDYYLNTYDSESKLTRSLHVFESPSQKDTTETLYVYKTDVNKRTVETVVQKDCSKCKSCGGCNTIRSTVVRYE